MPGLLRAGELARGDIEDLVAAARGFAGGPPPCHRTGMVVALVFFEDSLRTRVGFEAAAARLGATTTVVSRPKQTAQMAVAEAFEDTVRCVAPYCDVICLRHPEAGTADLAASLVPTPVVNCGNGNDEHPAHALVDLFAISQLHGRIDGLRIALVGDLRNMRTAHSLLVALGCFERVSVRCISPAGLEMPHAYESGFLRNGNSMQATTEMNVEDVDIVYVAGLPSTAQNGVSRADQRRYRIDGATVKRLDTRAYVLCPLPRVDEISGEVDVSARAAYFEQSALGLAMRMAILDRYLAARDSGANAPRSPSTSVPARASS